MSDGNTITEINTDWTKHWRSAKTYTAVTGLTCCFRQWRAASHCRFLHGYPIEVHLEFAAEELDENNWVVDFGSLKSLKRWLEDMFDHTTIVAQDDPELDLFKWMETRELIQLRIVPSCGMEKFAEFIYGYAERWLHDNGYTPRCRLVGVQVKEHDGNGAIFYKTPPRKKPLSYEVALESHEEALRDLVNNPNVTIAGIVDPTGLVLDDTPPPDRTSGFGHVEKAEGDV